MAWRTFNSWGHVSKARLYAEVQIRRNLAAQGRVSAKLAAAGPKAQELFDALMRLHIQANEYPDQLLPEAKRERYKDLCDALNKLGVSDDELERVLP